MSSKLTTHQFIQKARLIHGDRYEYSKTKYINAKTSVEIECPVHGTFWQNPRSHLKGSGCALCDHDSKRNSTESFVQKAKLIHGDRYDYSKVDYKQRRINVTITCRIHGDFEQSPHNHLKGSGCSKCHVDSRCFTNERFVERAKKIHGNAYDYSKSNANV